MRQVAACRVERAWTSSSASSPKTLRRPNASQRLLETDTEPAAAQTNRALGSACTLRYPSRARTRHQAGQRNGAQGVEARAPRVQKDGQDCARRGPRERACGRFARLRVASHRSRSTACPPPRPQTSRSCSRAAAVAAAARRRRARFGGVDLRSEESVGHSLAPGTCAARMGSLWTPCRRMGRRRAAWQRCGGGWACGHEHQGLHARVASALPLATGRPRRPRTAQARTQHAAGAAIHAIGARRGCRQRAHAWKVPRPSKKSKGRMLRSPVQPISTAPPSQAVSGLRRTLRTRRRGAQRCSWFPRSCSAPAFTPAARDGPPRAAQRRRHG